MAGKRELRLRITLVAPPAGVVFSLQDKNAAPVDAVASDGSDLSFDLSIEVADGEPGLRYLGPWVRANSGEKFVYVASGGQAGQKDTEWTRRLKVMLESLPADLVAQAAGSGARLEARIVGTMKDGGPVCAANRPAWALLPA